MPLRPPLGRDGETTTKKIEVCVFGRVGHEGREENCAKILFFLGLADGSDIFYFFSARGGGGGSPRPPGGGGVNFLLQIPEGGVL